MCLYKYAVYTNTTWLLQWLIIAVPIEDFTSTILLIMHASYVVVAVYLQSMYSSSGCSKAIRNLQYTAVEIQHGNNKAVVHNNRSDS